MAWPQAKAEGRGRTAVIKERRYLIADCMVGQCQAILSNKLSGNTHGGRIPPPRHVSSRSVGILPTS